MPFAPSVPLRLPFRAYINRLDPRWWQIGFLGTFLTYGVLRLGWHTEVYEYALVLGFAAALQLTLAHFTTRDYRSVLSGLITGLGLCLLLKTNSTWTMLFAVAFALLSKFTLRAGRKHFFNPANFGIVAAIVLTGDAWVSPGQWGHEGILVFLFCATGLLVVGRVGRLDTTLAFIGAFGGLMFLYNVAYLGWTADVWLHKLTNGSLLLFAFFMVTDPRSIPDHSRARVLWASCVAVVAFLLASNLLQSLLAVLVEAGLPAALALGSAPDAVVWALFLLAPLTPFLDRYWPAQRFTWAARPTNGLKPAVQAA